jgi:mitochondrial fission protein ELM1
MSRHDRLNRPTDSDRDRAPLVWLLVDDRPGHRTQVMGLARIAGYPAIEKRLAFNWLNRIPNPALGASLASLDRARSDALAPPWPDLILGMGRRVVPVARWIRRQSGGRTRVALLGRKAVGDADAADLSIACAHFRLLPHPRQIELTVPPTQIDRASLDAARAEHGDPLEGLARPRVLLLAGGPTAQHRFEAGFAGRMAGEVAAAVGALGGSLAIVTSRRTPAAAVEAMAAAAPGAHLHAWRADRKHNPYLAYLAAADLIVVTGESESMLAEAVATRRPVTIYPLEPKPEPLAQHLAGALRRGADGQGPWARLCRGLIGGGWVTPPRSLDVMHAEMARAGQARIFDGVLNDRAPDLPAVEEELARRIRALLRPDGGQVP